MRLRRSPLFVEEFERSRPIVPTAAVALVVCGLAAALLMAIGALAVAAAVALHACRAAGCAL